MGCDIHLYIEHRRANWDESWDWNGFGGKINPGRDYEMFTKMANVRGRGASLYEPRGLPSGVSYRARSDNQIYITESNSDDEEGTTTRERAERWVAQGSSVYTDERKQFVTHPDWHSHSWLTPDEFESCIVSVENVDSEYKAVLAALRSFEAQGEQARIVFWFDN